MYNEKVIKAFSEAKNTGKPANANGVGEVGSPSCGDVTKMYLVIENGIIVDAKFQTFGCAAAIASSEMTCDLIRGKTIEEAEKITNKQVVEALGGLPEAKVHCSVMAEEAIREAIKNYRENKK